MDRNNGMKIIQHDLRHLNNLPDSSKDCANTRSCEIKMQRKKPSNIAESISDEILNGSDKFSVRPLIYMCPYLPTYTRVSLLIVRSITQYLVIKDSE